VPASILGATWAFGRLWYALGYTSGAGPKGRTRCVALLTLNAEHTMLTMHI
jgi:hypothetical protein